MPRYTDLALGAGAVLVVGLGLLALKPDGLPTAPEGADASYSAPSGPLRSTASPSATPTPGPSGSASAQDRVAGAGGASSWVVGAGADVVVFAPKGDCGAAGPAQITVVRGAAAPSTYAVKGLAAVGGIDVRDQDTAVVLGVDADCKRVGFATKDGGRTWRALAKEPAIWSLVPGAKAEVHAPTGQVQVPCQPLAVTGLDARVARLACTDGRLLGTVSGGKEWSILGNNHEVQAVGFVSATTALALVDDPACKGVQVERSTDGGTAFKAAYCVAGAGPWGLFTNAETAVVVGSDAIARSADDGATWSAVPLGS